MNMEEYLSIIEKTIESSDDVIDIDTAMDLETNLSEKLLAMITQHIREFGDDPRYKIPSYTSNDGDITVSVISNEPAKFTMVVNTNYVVMRFTRTVNTRLRKTEGV